MVLVNYSDSESDTESVEKELRCPPKPITHSNKRKIEELYENDRTSQSIHSDIKQEATKQPPPLPLTFHTLYATNVRTSTTDDPSLHGGRKRQVTHVAGNWPTHISLEWLPSQPQLTQLDNLIAQFQRLITSSSPTCPPNSTTNHKATLHSFLRTALSAQLPLHISLSSPLALSTATKTTFRDQLRDAIREVGVGKIAIRFERVDLVANSERSRWFVVLRVREWDAGDRLMRLLDVCNATCARFGLDGLYQRGGAVGVGTGMESALKVESGVVDLISNGAKEEAEGGRGEYDPVGAFHVSIAWMLTGVDQNVLRMIREMDIGALGGERVEFDRVKIKIGNVVDDVLL